MIDLSDEGLKDLLSIKQHDAKLAADIVIRIEDIAGDQNAIKNLQSIRYDVTGRFNIRLYQKARQNNFYVFRIRFFKMAPAEHPGINDYRIFYFWNPGTKRYIIIAIEQKYMKKKIDHPYDDPTFMAALKERYDANFTT